MVKENSNDLSFASSDVLAKEAVKLLLEKLAGDVSMFAVREYTSITDYYVNCTGRSLSHVASLADDLSEVFEGRGISPARIEGKKGNTWILVDFGSLIVNIFDSEGRAFYNFDRLLPPDARMPIDDLVREVDEKFTLNKKEN